MTVSPRAAKRRRGPSKAVGVSKEKHVTPREIVRRPRFYGTQAVTFQNALTAAVGRDGTVSAASRKSVVALFIKLHADNNVPKTLKVRGVPKTLVQAFCV